MMKKMMMIIRINDKDGEFGGMLEDWTFGLLYLTYENLFESGGQIQITDATQSHHIARQTLGTTNLLVLIDRDITEGIALKLQQPKNDSSASTKQSQTKNHRLHCVCVFCAFCVFLLAFRSSFFFPGILRVSFLSLLFFLPYSILPLFSPFFASFSILPVFSCHILSPNVSKWKTKWQS